MRQLSAALHLWVATPSPIAVNEVRYCPEGPYGFRANSLDEKRVEYNNKSYYYYNIWF
jgi:hypothetical protein